MCGKGILKSKERILEKALKFSKKKSVYLKNPKRARLKTIPRIKKYLELDFWILEEVGFNGFGLEREKELFVGAFIGERDSTKGLFCPPPAQLTKKP